MKLLIKNMVCPRCIIVVRQILADMDLEAKNIFLGEVKLQHELPTEKLHLLTAKLKEVGFELIYEQKQLTVETIKKFIIEKVQSGIIEPHFNLSNHLKRNTFKDYSTLSKIFSNYEGCTIEKYFILQKLEKAKEMILYGDMRISSIARSLGYSSPQHFSSQFRKMFKYTPKDFKTFGAAARKPIDNIFL